MHDETTGTRRRRRPVGKLEKVASVALIVVGLGGVAYVGADYAQGTNQPAPITQQAKLERAIAARNVTIASLRTRLRDAGAAHAARESELVNIATDAQLGLMFAEEALAACRSGS